MLPEGAYRQVVLFRENHSVANWPSRTVPLSGTQYLMTLGLEHDLGFLASFPFLMVCPSLGMYSQP